MDCAGNHVLTVMTNYCLQLNVLPGKDKLVCFPHSTLSVLIRTVPVARSGVPYGSMIRVREIIGWPLMVQIGITVEYCRMVSI